MCCCYSSFVFIFFFFFKQKTAYEMRISDWSSDVCSSDLLYFSAPPQAPTTRGFASILYQGLNGAGADEILAVPGDFYTRLGLESAISPLRLRGMSAMLSRIKAHLGPSSPVPGR